MRQPQDPEEDASDDKCQDLWIAGVPGTLLTGPKDSKLKRWEFSWKEIFWLNRPSKSFSMGWEPTKTNKNSDIMICSVYLWGVRIWGRHFWNIPSLKLTWHLKITPWKRRFLLETIIFRCYGVYIVICSVYLWSVWPRNAGAWPELNLHFCTVISALIYL